MSTEISTKPIGILGGTFDPIHHGHLRLAMEAYYQLQLERVHFIPLLQAVHRQQPHASAEQRANMIRLAIDELPMLHLDQRELHRHQASYTIDTLKSLRKEFPDTPLCLLMGRDSFSTLDQWKEWQSILEFAHIVVASRHLTTHKPFSPVIDELLQTNMSLSLDELHNTCAGRIYLLNIPLLDISASEIREHLQQQRSVNYLLPETVIEFTQEHHLYAGK